MKNLMVLLSLIILPSNYACDPDGLTGFMPENDMRIPVGSKNSNQMTEKRFNEIIDKVEQVYKPIIKEKGGVLQVKRKWKNDTVNAYAKQFWKFWSVHMFGGLARHPAVTDDGFALVVCHEIGHHIGGAPKIGRRWASNEGQSDYFASLKCFREVFGSDDNITLVANSDVDPYAELKCRESWSNEEDVALCIRGAMAGKSLATLLGGGSRSVNFKTPDTSIVGSTDDRHPAGQCRLDTYFQGSLCEISRDIDVDKKDPTLGTCNRSTGHEIGIRPLCWYKP
jgi:hypothetical protein